MIDKSFCVSSYLAFRYLWKDDVDFFEGFHHKLLKLQPDEKKVKVWSDIDIDIHIGHILNEINSKYRKIGVLLSGGMDSAIVASYLLPGSHAYTFCATDSSVFDQDLQRAKKYCEHLGLIHHLVEISAEDFISLTPLVMKTKCAPVHSIEPQILKAALQAKQDGVEIMLIGDGADYVFGGMNLLLAKEWDYQEFIDRYIYIDPVKVLKQPDRHAMDLFLPYARPNGGIDFLKFMTGPNTEESYNSYWNAFKTAGLEYLDPYENMVMGEPLDLKRVRNGESKYLIRELFKIRYPHYDIPEKIPMPRPLDTFLKDWEGPSRPEFIEGLNMKHFSSNQKWLMWCLELFLNLYNKPCQ